MSNTISFATLHLEDVRQGGGKATSLAYMLQQGISVPNGFVVITDAYAAFRDADTAAEFEKELLEQFDALGCEYVAVRSSAIAEDSGGASWAGQLESFLNVTRDTLIKYVRECWASIDSSHAQDYAKDKNVSQEDAKVAVVVQQMIQSEVSGVMFTRDPTTSDDNQMIIEGVYGLGEMIVQGIVTPDTYVLSREPLVVKDFLIQIKSEQMKYQDGENKIMPVPADVADKSVLREKEVEELAQIGLKIESLYGAPQDIEWARQDGTFYIVQARPITTLA